MKSKELKSRYNDIETIAQLIDDNTVMITSNGQYTRCIFNDDDINKIQGIDFEGGPMISLGDQLFGKKIINIINGYIIELE